MSWVAPTPENVAAHQRSQDADRTGFLKPSSNRSGVHFPPVGAPVINQTLMSMQFGEWPGDATKDLPDDEANAARGVIRELADDEDLQSLRALHGVAISRFRDVVNTIAQVRDDDDPSLNHDGRLKIAARIVEPKLDSLAQAAATEIARVDQTIAQLDQRIGQAARVADPVDVVVHADIRAHIRSLGGSLAVAAAAQALIDGDLQTMQAIATAPAYLSGLGGERGTAPVRVYAEITEALREQKSPTDYKRLKALRVGKACMLQALSALDTKANQLLDFKRARQLHERDAAREERYRAKA